MGGGHPGARRGGGNHLGSARATCRATRRASPSRFARSPAASSPRACRLSVKFGREPALVAEGVTLTNAPWASRPELARVRRLTMYLEPFSLLLGEAKVGKVLLEGAEIAGRAQRSGRRQPRDAAAARRLGPACRREPLAAASAHSPAFPWINTIEVRDSVLTVSEGAGRPPVVLECGARHLQVDRRPISRCRSRREPQRAAGDAARAHRHVGFVRRLDAGLAGQHRCAGRLRRRQDRDQGQHRHQGHQLAGHAARARTSRSSVPMSACRCRRAVPTC